MACMSVQVGVSECASSGMCISTHVCLWRVSVCVVVSSANDRPAPGLFPLGPWGAQASFLRACSWAAGDHDRNP